MNEVIQVKEATKFSGWNILIGCWLIASPFVLGFAYEGHALWNDIAVGAVVAILALLRATGVDRRGSASWLNIALGIWLVISPFALGFLEVTPVLNNIATGLVVAIVALVSLFATRKATTQPQPA